MAETRKWGKAKADDFVIMMQNGELSRRKSEIVSKEGWGQRVDSSRWMQTWRLLNWKGEKLENDQLEEREKGKEGKQKANFYLVNFIRLVRFSAYLLSRHAREERERSSPVIWLDKEWRLQCSRWVGYDQRQKQESRIISKMRQCFSAYLIWKLVNFRNFRAKLHRPWNFRDTEFWHKNVYQINISRSFTM